MSDAEKIQRMGEEAANGLSATLVSLLGRDDAAIFLSQAAPWDSDSASQAVSGSFLSVVLQGEGPASGGSLLLTKEKDACVIADLVIGQDGANAPDKMTELHVSAFGEVVAQMVDTLSQAARSIGAAKAAFRVKTSAVLPPAEVADQVRRLGPSLVAFTFSVSVPGLVASEMYFYLPESVAEKLTAAPGAKAPESVKVAAVKPSAPAGVQHTGGAAVQKVQHDPYAGGSAVAGGNINLLMDVPLKLTVELGRTTKLVKEILALAPGAVVELDKLAGEAVDILVNEKLIAKGEVVVIDENFGVRITEIVNPEERLSGLQS
jgi:flagellar motor switch protein FliN/FliY